MAWAVFVAYLAIGIITSRFVFTRILGENPRHIGGAFKRNSNAYNDAIFAGVMSIVLWPLVGLFFYMTRPTPNEKKRMELKRREEMIESRERKLKALNIDWEMV